MASYETYPVVDHFAVDHGLIITRVAQNGIQEVVVHDSFLSKWTARAVVATYVAEAS